MKTMSILSIAATALVMNCAVAASANDNRPANNPSTTNPDGTRRTATNNFASADTNGDGFVSSAELSAHGNASLQFNTLDTDRDGRVSNAEWSTYFRNNPDMDDDE